MQGLRPPRGCRDCGCPPTRLLLHGFTSPARVPPNRGNGLCSTPGLLQSGGGPRPARARVAQLPARGQSARRPTGMRGGSCFPRGSWSAVHSGRGQRDLLARSWGEGRSRGSAGLFRLLGRHRWAPSSSGRAGRPWEQPAAGLLSGRWSLTWEPPQHPLWWKGRSASTHFRSISTQPGGGRSVGGSQVELASCTVTPPLVSALSA